MANQTIAPPAQLNVADRIKKIESYLNKEETRLSTPAEVTEPVTVPQQPVTQPMALNQEMISLLKKISENQEIDRKRYERNNPVEGDDPIYDFAEETISPGQIVQFIYTIPEGRAFFLEYVSVVHNIDTTYYIWIDGEYEPTLSYAIQDFGDHMEIWRPPKLAYNKVEVWCLNNWVANQTYAVFFQGFNRWYRSLHREIQYDHLVKEREQKT